MTDFVDQCFEKSKFWPVIKETKITKKIRQSSSTFHITHHDKRRDIPDGLCGIKELLVGLVWQGRGK